MNWIKHGLGHKWSYIGWAGAAANRLRRTWRCATIWYAAVYDYHTINIAHLARGCHADRSSPRKMRSLMEMAGGEFVRFGSFPGSIRERPPIPAIPRQ